MTPLGRQWCRKSRVGSDARRPDQCADDDPLIETAVREELFSPGLQNSRHGEKIHAIATGREHRCSGWAGLHRRRSTACGLRKRGVNADAGSEFIAPSSQHPSHMPLHFERPGGAETVARQQPWSNREPPMSGVLDSGGLECGHGRPGAISLGRCGEPFASGERQIAGSVLALPDCDNLVDGEVAVLEGERAGCEVEQPGACSGWGDELLRVLP